MDDTFSVYNILISLWSPKREIWFKITALFILTIKNDAAIKRSSSLKNYSNLLKIYILKIIFYYNLKPIKND